jgi:hypothetical protein
MKNWIDLKNYLLENMDKAGQRTIKSKPHVYKGANVESLHGNVHWEVR